MEYIVTGGAGYIGGHMVDSLVNGNKVTVLDDLSSGSYMNKASKFIKVDLSDRNAVENLDLEKGSCIIHLAANPSVIDSMRDVGRHFRQDVTATLNTLELARRIDASKFIFASSSVVYGDAKKIPTPENYRLKPISNYGLFKFFGEELVERHSHDYGIKSVSMRLANVIGGRSNHGIIPDFIAKLRNNPQELNILGDGRQRKSYIYISDVIAAMNILSKKKVSGHLRINIGNTDSVSVNEIADYVTGGMGLHPKYSYNNSNAGRGWKGDVKVMLLDIRKMQKLGWNPTLSSALSVKTAVKDLLGKNQK